MQKIYCPRCGVVNLEQFVTFPNCAACGTLLPQSVVAARLPIWRRPLGPLLWITIIGGTVVSLVAATAVFEAVPDESGQVVIYGHAPRTTQLGRMVTAHLTVDAVDEPAAQRKQPLRNVKLRLSRDFFKKFRFVSLDPKPDAIISVAGGRYFQYVTLPRETQLHLKLWARHRGHHRWVAHIYADDHFPGEFPHAITVSGHVPAARRREKSLHTIISATDR